MRQAEKEFWKEINPPKYYSDYDYLHKGKQAVAANRLKQAVNNGTIIKETVCVTCDCESDDLVAHHWKGYDYPFKVWWVCRSCNYYLPHDGRSVESARKFIIKKKFNEPMYYLAELQKRIEHCGVCDIPDKIRNMNIVNNYPYEQMIFVCEPCYSRIDLS